LRRRPPETRASAPQDQPRGLLARQPRTLRHRRGSGVAVAAALRAPSAAATRASLGRTSEPVDLTSLSLMEKVAFAWSVFFPPKEADHARNDAKKRLRMILVADRCALSPQVCGAVQPRPRLPARPRQAVVPHGRSARVRS
jgi:hypothetical protein